MNIEIGSNEAGQRVDKFVRKLMKDVPLSAIYKALRKGQIKVNGKKAKEKYMLALGDVLDVYEMKFSVPKKTIKNIENNELKVSYEDENMVIVEKWPGILVHSDSVNAEPSLTDYVLSYLFERGNYNPEEEVTFTPAPCNRLDRNTSGLVIYGKNFEALKLLNEMIRKKDTEKYYYALATGKLKDGDYSAYIRKNEHDNISRVFDEEKEDTKQISMKLKTIKCCGTYSLFEIQLLTGRSHQIRAHLSHLGCKIIGDSKYGDKQINSYFYNKYDLDYQYLYAYKLIFRNCPEKLEYMNNKTVVHSIPQIFKKIKNDIFRFEL